MVATPMYDGAQGPFVRAAMALALSAQTQGMGIDFSFLLHQPCIDRARAMLVDGFLRSDFTHLMFVDADVDFAASDIFSMLATMQRNPACGVIGPPFPRRKIHWGNVARAALMGLAADEPERLARFSGDFAFAFLHDQQMFRLDEIVELEHLGSALMIIRRDVIEALVARHPELAYRPDAEERQAYGLGERVHALFQPMIEPKSQRLLAEDYAFCRRVRDCGFRIWLAPWARTSHTGPATFAGTLADLAPLSAVPQE